MEVPEIRAGQIWREVDPRFERFLYVEAVVSSRTIHIRTVVKNDAGKWWPARFSRLSEAHPSRFNGKRGGYALVEDVSQ